MKPEEQASMTDAEDKQEESCGCAEPDIWSRHCYSGDKLERGSGYCKNCDATWEYSTTLGQWVRSDNAVSTTPGEKRPG